MVTLSIINEINSLYDYIKAMYPTAIISRQDVPSSPVANTFVIRSQYTDSQTETSLTNVIAREYQLIYYGTSSVDALTKMDALAHVFKNSRLSIPLRSSSRFIRVKGFNFGTVYLSANSVNYVIGVIQAEMRDAREITESTKIGSVNVTTNEG